MRIFYKRPLSSILCIMLSGLLLGALVPGYIFGISVSVASLIFVIIELLSKKFKIRLFTRICIIFFSLSLLFSQCYFSNFYAEEREDVGIIATVEDVVGEGSYYKSVALRTKEIDRKYENMLLLAYINTDALEENLDIGDEIYIFGNIEKFSSDGSFDAKLYYTSRGYSGIISEINEVELTGNKNGSLRASLSSWRLQFAKSFESMTTPRVGGLLSALLLGERTGLDGDISLSFTRIGISHILALSGMHLVILSLIVEKLLSLFFFGKKTKSVINIFFVIFYMAFTGFGASVTRAGIMLIITKSIFLLAGTRDSITSLFIAATAICLFSPSSLFDMSLWLSVLATFGVILAGEFMSKTKTQFRNKALGYVSTSVITTFFALGAVLLLSVNIFGGISAIAPISTLVFSLLVEILMYFGTALLFFGGFIPALGAITNAYGEFIIDLASVMSSGELIYSSSNFSLVKIFSLIFTVLFLLFAILKIERKRLFAGIMLSIYSLIVVISLSQTQFAKNTSSAVAFSNGESDGILLTDSGECIYVDISSGNSSAYYAAKSNLDSIGITYVDKYMVTNYSYNLPIMTDRLLSGIKVSELLIPEPQSDEEYSIAIKIYELANKSSLRVTTYKEGVISGDRGIFLVHRSLYKDRNKEVLIHILGEDFAYTYSSRGLLDNSEINRKASELIASSDAAIFGCFGKNKSEITSLEIISDGLQRIVIFDDSLVLGSYAEEKYSDGQIIRGKARVRLTH